MEVRNINYSPAIQLPHHSPLQQVACTMSRHEAKCVVITREDSARIPRPVGIVTERDVVILLLHYAGDLSVAIEDAMINHRVITIDENASSHEAIQLMSRHGIHKLPVTDGEGRISGVLTVDNLLQHLAHPGHKQFISVVQQVI